MGTYCWLGRFADDDDFKDWTALINTVNVMDSHGDDTLRLGRAALLLVVEMIDGGRRMRSGSNSRESHAGPHSTSDRMGLNTMLSGLNISGHHRAPHTRASGLSYVGVYHGARHHVFTNHD